MNEYLERLDAVDTAGLTLVFKAGEGTFKLSACVVNIQCLFNSDVAPVRYFNMSHEWWDSHERGIVLKVNNNILLRTHDRLFAMITADVQIGRTSPVSKEQHFHKVHMWSSRRYAMMAWPSWSFQHLMMTTESLLSGWWPGRGCRHRHRLYTEPVVSPVVWFQLDVVSGCGWTQCQQIPA